MKFKFTIQQMLWATLAFGFVAIVMSAAYRGSTIATGVLIAPLVMVITFVVMAAVYWACYLVSRLLHPPIHTPAQTSFSRGHSRYGSDSVVSAPANLNPPVDKDVSTGAPE